MIWLVAKLPSCKIVYQVCVSVVNPPAQVHSKSFCSSGPNNFSCGASDTGRKLGLPEPGVEAPLPGLESSPDLLSEEERKWEESRERELEVRCEEDGMTCGESRVAVVCV